MWRRALVGVPLFLLALWTFIPFLVTISVSLKSRVETFANLGLIPEDFTINAYREVLTDPTFTSAFFNSLVVGSTLR